MPAHLLSGVAPPPSQNHRQLWRRGPTVNVISMIPTQLEFPSFHRLSGIFRRRQWHPTPVLLPGESQGRGSLVGCHLWGRTELDTTEAT